MRTLSILKRFFRSIYLRKGLIPIKNKYVFKAVLLNPLVLLLYYYLSAVLVTYLDIGGTTRRLPTIIAGFTGLSVWMVTCVLCRKKISQFKNSTVLELSPYYVTAAVILLAGITIYTGIQTVELAQTFGTPLHRRIRQWQTETRIDLEGLNVFEQGVEGVFESIDNEVDLPDSLYLTNDIGLQFNRSGDVMFFSASIFGENESGEYEGFLIYTDYGSDQIVVIEQEVRSVSEEDEEMLVSPLLETLDQLSLVEIIQEWPDEDAFELFYMGYRSFGYNSDGVYYTEDHGPVELGFAEDEIEGFAVSVFVIGKTEEITPKRYIDRSYNAAIEQLRSEEEVPVELGHQVDESEQEIYFLTEDIGYRLPVVDAATGSRWYGFEKTIDGGVNWETVNPDPFDGRSGRTSGVTFFNEDFGFSALERGSQGTLFRTDNGGSTFDAIEFPEVRVSLSEEADYNPFQFPEMPYEAEGKLYVLVGQGPDGDYNRGAKALYQSEDKGETWQFVEEVEQ